MRNATLFPARSHRCPQHTDEQRRAVRVFLLGPSASTLPDPDLVMESDGYDVSDGQVLTGRLQWDGSSDISPSDSASSKASTTNSDSRRTKKKKKPSSLSLTTVGADRGERDDRGGSLSGGVGTSGSSQSALGHSGRKKKPKLSAPLAPSIYDDLN